MAIMRIKQRVQPPGEKENGTHSPSWKRSKGRPTRLNEEVKERICAALIAGNFPGIAALYGRVSRNTYFNWLERGRREREAQEVGKDPSQKEKPFLEFLDAVEMAQARAEMAAIAQIRKAALAGDWKASAWLLARAFPQKWGKRLRA